LIKYESQLYGEMLVAAMGRYGRIKADTGMYGMLLMGPYIRFYRTMFAGRYLRDLETDKDPSMNITIERYPPDSRRGLSLIDRHERMTAVRILSVIRDHVESMVV